MSDKIQSECHDYDIDGNPLYAYRVSFYAKGARRPSDGTMCCCRYEAEKVGQEALALAAMHGDTSYGWVNRYTIRRFKA